MDTIPTITVDRFRAFAAEQPRDTYNLVDVRQPSEFEQGHIPGAQLIPLNELPQRMNEIDAKKPTVVCCRSGARSGSATGMLLAAGFEPVFNLVGGMLAWSGQVAAGLPDAGMSLFTHAKNLDTLIAQAHDMEVGAERFYAEVARRTDEPVAAVFRELGEAEVHHQHALKALYERLTGEPAPFTDQTPTAIEGGVSLAAALKWLDGKGVKDIMEFTLAMEVTAFDRYVQLQRLAPDPESRALFKQLGDNEQRHVEQALTLFTQWL